MAGEVGGTAADDDRVGKLRALVPEATSETVHALIAESDEITAIVSEREPATQTRYLLHAMERVPVAEEEARAYYAEHPNVFGSRPFGECRPSIEKILRAKKIREGSIPPENEWSWKFEGGSSHRTLNDVAGKAPPPVEDSEKREGDTR